MVNRGTEGNIGPKIKVYISIKLNVYGLGNKKRTLRGVCELKTTGKVVLVCLNNNITN
jgi:hypothetical protein